MSSVGLNSPRAKRKVTVLVSTEDASNNKAGQGGGHLPAVTPSVQPPLTPSEQLASAFRCAKSLIGEEDPWLVISMLEDAARGLYDEATTPGAVAVTSATPSSAVASAHAPDRGEPSSSREELHSLDSSSTSEFSDAESSHPSPGQQGPPVVYVAWKARLASSVFMSAAVRALQLEDAKSIKLSVALAEEALQVWQSPRAVCLLAWCCIRYADVAEDPTLRARLEDHALSLISDRLSSLDCDAHHQSNMEWIALTEAHCWVCAATGNVTRAIASGEALMSKQALQGPYTALLLALLYSGIGCLEKSAATLEWVTHVFPLCYLAHALLAAVQCTTGRWSIDEAQATLVRQLCLLQGLEDYTRGSSSSSMRQPILVGQSAPVADFNSVSIGHHECDWNHVTSISGRLGYCYLFVSICARKVGLHSVADAASTAAVDVATASQSSSSNALACSVFYNEALCCLENSNRTSHDAIELLGKCLALNPMHVDANCAMGEVLRIEQDAHGGASEATAHWMSACRSNPRCRRALEGLARSHSSKCNYSAAAELLLTAAEIESAEPLLPVSLLYQWVPLV